MNIMWIFGRAQPKDFAQTTPKQVEMEMPRIPKPPSVMDNHVVRASKEYHCPVCGGTIFKTQRCIKYVWRDAERKLHSEHRHERCKP